jgi:hypothetical protein
LLKDASQRLQKRLTRVMLAKLRQEYFESSARQKVPEATKP